MLPSQFTIIILGETSTLGPQEVVFGPEKFKKKANSLFEKSGKYGSSDDVCNRWNKLLKDYNKG